MKSSLVALSIGIRVWRSRSLVFKKKAAECPHLKLNSAGGEHAFRFCTLRSAIEQFRAFSVAAFSARSARPFAGYIGVLPMRAVCVCANEPTIALAAWPAAIRRTSSFYIDSLFDYESF